MYPSSHRAEIDWLRVLAFGALVPLHAAIPFIPGGLPLIQNGQTSAILELAVAWLHEFRLPLLFLVAGMGLFWSWRKRGWRGVVKERAWRLLIPLLAGMVLLVPPMVYLEKRFIGAIEPGFWAFYQAMPVSGTYPVGHLSWHHYWFIAYLFLFVLAGLTVIRLARLQYLWPRLDGLVSLLGSRFGLLLPIIPLALGEWWLRARFPGMPNLIHDWANILLWMQIFLLGVAFAARPRLLDGIERLRHLSLFLAVDLSAVLYLLFVAGEAGPRRVDALPAAVYPWFCLLRSAHIWCWVLAISGFALRHLKRGSSLLRYLNEAVYPLFCLHLPVIVAVAYLIVPLNVAQTLNVSIKFALVTASGFLIPLAIHQWLLRPLPWLGVLFGMRFRAQSTTTQPRSFS